MPRPHAHPTLNRRAPARLRFLLAAPIASLLFAAIPLPAAEIRLPTVVAPDAEPAQRRSSDTQAVVHRLDALLSEHWRARSIAPAPAADDDAFLRRLTLDLIGRLPTPAEHEAYLAASAATRRAAAVDGLLAGPEFPLHFARVIDDWVQRTDHGDEPFVGWLRTALAQRRSWSMLFERLMVGPWTDEADKPAARFLSKRAKNLDALTADTARAFFGVDITCARCHDHPLVDDWKQDHYYGLAAFLHRTQAGGKDKPVGEKSDGELTFESRLDGQKTAAPLYLTDRTVDPATKGSRRAQLVATVLDERHRFSRAAANRIWAWFFGRGLVEPVDQMHSANPPSVPGVLELLADDLAENGYDLTRTVRIVVTSEAYGLGSRPDDGTKLDPGAFAAAALRPLTPRQYALSLVLSAGDGNFAATAGSKRVEAYQAAEKIAATFLAGLDETVDGYRPGVGEALYLSNHEAVQKLFAPQERNLAARLASEPSADKRTIAAFRAILARRPSPAELAQFADVEPSELLWILATSVECRFNH